MTEPANASEARDDGFLAPKPGSKPVDHCFRCGRATAPGVGLCDEHNPHHMKGPSPNQMHATIFGGIALGVLGFFVLATLAVGSTGPYEAEVTSASVDPDGTASIAYTVTNGGEDEGVADCRVTLDGVPRPEDYAFRTTRVPGGETVAFEKTLDTPEGSPVQYDAENLSVICS